MNVKLQHFSCYLALLLSAILLMSQESRAVAIKQRSLEMADSIIDVASQPHLNRRQDEGDGDDEGDGSGETGASETEGQIGYGEGELPQQGDTPACSDPSDLDGDCDSTPIANDDPSTATYSPTDTTITYTPDLITTSYVPTYTTAAPTSTSIGSTATSSSVVIIQSTSVSNQQTNSETNSAIMSCSREWLSVGSVVLSVLCMSFL